MELTRGDLTVHQLGGSYGRIKRYLRRLNISGYEVHHIPSKSVMRGWGTVYSMTAIALKKEDHEKTDSFREKARKKIKSFLPDVNKETSYQKVAKEKLSNEQVFDLIKMELLNIREQCGHKYDGAISQYLDALEEYVKTHGFPLTSDNSESSASQQH